jgi:hypothetical protein
MRTVKTMLFFLIIAASNYHIQLCLGDEDKDKPIEIKANNSVFVDCRSTTNDTNARALASAGVPNGLFFTETTGAITCQNEKGRTLWQAVYTCRGSRFVPEDKIPFGTAKLTCSS